jgi:hypothetical protein
MGESPDSQRQSDEFWARDEWTFPDTSVGTDVFLLHAQIEKWVLRRIEKVEFLDDRSVRRQVTIDVELPLHPPLSGDQYFLPLALLTKQPLVGFDIWDESNTSLPILTRWENARIAWSMVVSVAEFGLDATLDEAVVSDIFAIVSAEAWEAERLYNEFIESANPLKKTLTRDEDLRSLLLDLASNFVLMVPITFDAGARRIIKFSYVEPIEFERFTWRQRLGQEPAPIRFDLPAIDEGASFHFEAEAPEGLDIYEGEIVRLPGGSGGTEERLAYNPERAQRMHLYPRDLPKNAAAEARIWLLPTAAGLIRASLIFCSGVFAMLLVLYFRLPQASARAPSLLLSVPGLIGLFLVRPTENRMATRMLFWFRAAVTFSGFLPFVGSLVLLIDLPECPERRLWGLLTALSLLAVFVVGESYAASRKT